MNEFAKELKLLRLKYGFSGRTLAIKIGKADTYVSQLENGKIVNPNPESLNKLMDEMGLSQLEKLNLISKLPSKHEVIDGTIFTAEYCEKIAKYVYNEIKGYPFEVQKRLMQKIINNL